MLTTGPVAIPSSYTHTKKARHTPATHRIAMTYVVIQVGEEEGRWREEEGEKLP